MGIKASFLHPFDLEFKVIVMGLYSSKRNMIHVNVNSSSDEEDDEEEFDPQLGPPPGASLGGF